jgi:hypothetical protein
MVLDCKNTLLGVYMSVPKKIRSRINVAFGGSCRRALRFLAGRGSENAEFDSSFGRHHQHSREHEHGDARMQLVMEVL